MNHNVLCVWFPKIFLHKIEINKNRNAKNTRFYNQFFLQIWRDPFFFLDHDTIFVIFSFQFIKMKIINVKMRHLPHSIKTIFRIINCQNWGTSICFCYTAITFEYDYFSPDFVIDLIPFVQHLLNVFLESWKKKEKFEWVDYTKEKVWRGILASVTIILVVNNEIRDILTPK